MAHQVSVERFTDPFVGSKQSSGDKRTPEGEARNSSAGGKPFRGPFRGFVCGRPLDLSKPVV